MEAGEGFGSNEVMHHARPAGVVCAVVELGDDTAWILKRFIPIKEQRMYTLF